MSMNENRIAGQEADLDSLRKLIAGDKLYTIEYQYTPEGGGAVKIDEFEFVSYTTKQSTNHTDVELDEDEILGKVKKASTPDINIPPQDLSVGWYVSKKSATLSFLDAMRDIYETVQKFADDEGYSGSS